MPTLAREHWGADEHGLARVRTFIAWHLDFWHRYVPRRADGTFPHAGCNPRACITRRRSRRSSRVPTVRRMISDRVPHADREIVPDPGAADESRQREPELVETEG